MEKCFFKSNGDEWVRKTGNPIILHGNNRSPVNLHRTRQNQHEPNAKQNAEKLHRRLLRARFFVKLGDQVGACDVEEVSGGDGE